MQDDEPGLLLSGDGFGMLQCSIAGVREICWKKNRGHRDFSLKGVGNHLQRGSTVPCYSTQPAACRPVETGVLLGNRLTAAACQEEHRPQG